MLLTQADPCFLKVFDVVSKLLDLLLNLDDRNVRDNGQCRIEKITNVILAILARLCPQRTNDELVLAWQLLGFSALFGRIAQNIVDGAHKRARFLIFGIALARVGGLRCRFTGCTVGRGIRGLAGLLDPGYLFARSRFLFGEKLTDGITPRGLRPCIVAPHELA